MSAIWAESDDDELVARVRQGGVEAYDLLFERYAARARRVARQVLDDPTEIDDVVSETFLAVLRALQGGKGPTEAFAGYLVSSVRHEAYRANRRRAAQRQHGGESDEPADDPFAGREDADILRAAFGSLPVGARDVLWRTEVEGRSHADIASTDGSTAQAIAARAARAREALGGAYLAGHLDLAFEAPPATPQCSKVRPQLVALVRGTASRRRRRALEGHLAECAPCRQGCDRLARLNERLRTAPLMPLTTGVSTLAMTAGKVSLVARLASAISPAAAGAVAVTTLATAAVLAPSFGEATFRSSGDGPPAVVTTTSLGQAGADQQPASLRRSGPPVVDVQRVSETLAPNVTVPTSTAAAPTEPATGASVAPATTTPTTTPVTTVPAPTSPPAAAAPAITLPAVNVPALTLPAITVPALTVPALAVPSISTPMLTTPAITTPPITTPAITLPAVTTPPITVPPITVPLITLPPLTVPPLLPGL